MAAMHAAKDRHRYFDSDFVAQHVQRFGKKPPEQRPMTYDIAVEDEYLPWRDWLDEQLGLLPASEAVRASGRIWADEHFWPVIFELATGAALRAHGHRVAYDAEWDGKTPDWTVLHSDGRPACFVEVHTDSPVREVYQEMRAWHGLARRLRQVAIPVDLTLAAAATKARPPQAGTAKKIAQDLGRQLYAINLPHTVSSNGYTFVVQARGISAEHGLRTRFIPPTSIAGVVDGSRLSERVEKKVSKYAGLVEQYQVPLVVAVGAHRFTGLNLQHVDDLLNGSPTTTFQFGPGDGFVGTAEWDLNRPKRWEMPPGLSGLLWIDNVYPFGATLRPNDHALRLLPSGFGYYS